MNLRGALRKKIGAVRKLGGIEYPHIEIKEPKHLIIFPAFKKATEIDLKYPLLEPFVYAHIRWDQQKRGLFYEVLEPSLSKNEREMFETVKKDLLEIIDVELSAVREEGKILQYL